MEKKKYDNMTPELAAQVRAYRRQIRLSIGAMVLAIGITAVSTLAWFASNRSVDSQGMKTQVAVNSNMVISDSVDNIRNMTLSDQTTPFCYTFNTAPKELFPARHGFTSPINDTPCPTGLYYNDNPEEVGFSNGLQSGTTALTFAPVPNDSSYYQDFEVYIASTGKAFTATAFVATMSIDPIDQEYVNAASIDFYVDSVSDSNYAGTLNAAKWNYDENDHSTKTESIDLIRKITGGLIPLNTDESSAPIHVIMRCYFDGGLKKNDTTTYVRSDGLILDQSFSMSVNFTATEQADAGSNS